MRNDPMNDTSILNMFGKDKWDVLKEWLATTEEKEVSSEKILKKMKEIEKKQEIHYQNLTEICRKCGFGHDIRSCGCEWSKEYFASLRL